MARWHFSIGWLDPGGPRQWSSWRTQEFLPFASRLSVCLRPLHFLIAPSSRATFVRLSQTILVVGFRFSSKRWMNIFISRVAFAPWPQTILTVGFHFSSMGMNISYFSFYALLPRNSWVLQEDHVQPSNREVSPSHFIKISSTSSYPLT